MATIVLSAVGAHLGAGFGSTVLGLSGAVIGRAVGATVGRVIDQRLLGAGSQAVETGRIDRMRIQSAGEGAPIARIWGQMRVPGHVIWAAPLEEVATEQGGGKGAPKPRVTEISYRLTAAMALCEGVIQDVGRVWADGEEVAASELNMRVYRGDETQQPDPAIVALIGDEAPAYRGIAYVVLENLSLERWGNRMPQLTFEVTRPAQDGTGLSGEVEAVAMIPGTGDYALATTAVTQDLGQGERRSVNVNTPMGGTDFSVSMDILGRELPKVGSVSLVVSWFGNDLRVGSCSVRPKVEDMSIDGSEMAWRAGGIGRDDAQEVTRAEGRPIYGGTPADQSVIEALRGIADSGRKAVFYPFILMEQVLGNGLPDPYGRDEQPALPWRGRITTGLSPDHDLTSDGTAAAEAEVAAFFGQASPADFQRAGDDVAYSGPSEWSYRRFILHYAHLCAAAEGIDAFLIGSEMVGLTRIRGANGRYPAVEALRALAADCRAILGPAVKIGYAADWSEYFGHHLPGGDLRFHLDPLWADANIDFIGIDNYMPLSDWRDGVQHRDASWGRIDNLDYLRANVAGGEGFDWYYASPEHRSSQRRTPISDGAYGEPWVWRYKDLAGWWQNRHHDRIGGIRAANATGWEPGSKPIWFTEIGCAAIDKGTNQPNKFLDAMSSESSLPHYSNARRDDAVQAAYIAATMSFWRDPVNNPQGKDGIRMIDTSRAHVWCWDARPYPAFPARLDLWSDGPAWERGHWLNGRAGAVPLASVVAEICAQAGIAPVDTSGLSGVVRGYSLQGGESGRSALQPLMLAHGFDAVEREGVLCFVMRNSLPVAEIGAQHIALADDIAGIEVTRAPDPEMVGRVRLTHVAAGGDYAAATAEAILPDDPFASASDSEFPLVLTRTEGADIAERWLAEARAARDTARFALPPSLAYLGAGDVVTLHHDAGSEPRRWRIDRMSRAGASIIDAVRVEEGAYAPALRHENDTAIRRYVPPMPVWPMFMDLPLLRGDEVPHAPWLAATATPWPGSVAAFVSAELDGGYDLNLTLDRRAVIGVTETPLRAARPGVLDRGAPLRVLVKGGEFRSISADMMLAGGNVVAIGDGSAENWEVIQFQTAQLVAPGVWDLSERLRGQAGSDAVMPTEWPAGSIVVLLNGATRQVKLPPASRGQMRHWRIGPALRGPEDASYASLTTQFAGVGLRPLSPSHLRLDGARLSWIRRTRIDGDGWDGPDVPLGESREAYLVRIIRDGGVVHEVVATAASINLPAPILSDGTFTAAVAQLSDQFGPGPFARRNF